MKRSDAKQDLKTFTPIISGNIKSETDKEILDKIRQREEESEALKKLLINLNEPIKNKRKQTK